MSTISRSRLIVRYGGVEVRKAALLGSGEPGDGRRAHERLPLILPID